MQVNSLSSTTVCCFSLCRTERGDTQITNMKTKYTVDGTSFYGAYQQKLDWKGAISKALELTGGVMFFSFAFKMTSGTNLIYLMLACSLLWVVYLTNKIAD